MRIHLVRHGAPLIDVDREPASWDLDEAGLAEIDRLGSSGALPDGARWVSSSEPKALQTAQRLAAGREPAVRLEEDSGFCEQRRPSGWVKDFAIHIHRALVTPETAVAEGWEPAAATRARVSAATRALMEQDPGRDLVLVGHGTAWLLLVSELTSRPVDLVAWERLLMPDHCVIEDGALVEPWGAWREPA